MPAVIVEALEIFLVLLVDSALREIGVTRCLNTAVVLVQTLRHFIHQRGIEAADDRFVQMRTVDGPRLLHPHFSKLRCPGALRYTLVKIRGIGHDIPLIPTALILHALRVDPFAVFAIGAERQRLAIADGSLRHSVAALLRIALRRKNKRRLAALSVPLCQQVVKCRRNESVMLFCKFFHYFSFLWGEYFPHEESISAGRHRACPKCFLRVHALPCSKELRRSADPSR